MLKQQYYDRTTKGQRISHLTLATSWVYLISLVVIWILLYALGDSWWFATLLLFGPRWIYALPLLVLVPAALILRRRALWLHLAAALVVVGPIMGLCLPWRVLFTRNSSVQPLRIITCNAHSDELDRKTFGEFADQTKPDIICLQDVHKKDVAALFGAPWHTAGDGEHSLVSRFPIRTSSDVAPELTHVPFVDRFDVETPQGVITILNIHLTSPHTAFKSTLEGVPNAAQKIDDNNQQRENEMQLLHAYLQSIHHPIILAGDFNTPLESADFRHNFGSLGNAFTVAGTGFGLTYHFGGTNARIDHILFSDAWQCRRSWVGPNVGSPHRPVIADLYRRQQ